MLTRFLLISFTIILAGAMSSAVLAKPINASQPAVAGKKQCLGEGVKCGALNAAAQCCPGSVCQGGPRNMYCRPMK
jgi:hypothetical protein